MVGHHAVLLLGHGAVERAQARLDVPDAQAELGGGQGAGQGRGGVAVDEHHVRGLGREERLEALEHQRQLGHRGAGADLEGVVRPRHAQLVEEEVGQLGVVVLAAVHQHLVDARGAGPG